MPGLTDLTGVTLPEVVHTDEEQAQLPGQTVATGLILREDQHIQGLALQIAAQATEVQPGPVGHVAQVIAVQAEVLQGVPATAEEEVREVRLAGRPADSVAQAVHSGAVADAQVAEVDPEEEEEDDNQIIRLNKKQRNEKDYNFHHGHVLCCIKRSGYN